MGNSFSSNIAVAFTAVALGVGFFMFTTIQNAKATARIGANVYSALPEGTGAAVGALLL